MWFSKFKEVGISISVSNGSGHRRSVMDAVGVTSFVGRWGREHSAEGDNATPVEGCTRATWLTGSTAIRQEYLG